jgi:hypothetical protein
MELQPGRKAVEIAMRAVLTVLILAIVAVIAAVASGFVDINQIRGGQAPEVAATNNGVTAKGGRAPAFDVETGSVKVGTGEANVTMPKVTLGKEDKQVRVPTLEIRPADQQGNKSGK